MAGSLFVTVRDKKRNIIVSITKRALELSKGRYQLLSEDGEPVPSTLKKSVSVAAPAVKKPTDDQVTVADYSASKISNVENPGPPLKKRGRPKKIQPPES